MLYCDQRSQEEEAKLTEKIDPLHFYEITGHRISASYSVEKLMCSFKRCKKKSDIKAYNSSRCDSSSNNCCFCWL